MILFEFDYPKYQATFYHDTDINPEDVVSWEKVMHTDIGKYVKFDDGSELYAKVLGGTSKVIVTSAGMYRRAGLVHVALPLDKNTSVFGIHSSEVHPLVRAYTPSERMNAKKLRSGEIATSTRRVMMLVSEEIKNELDTMNINSSWFARRLIEEAEIRGGKNFQFAMSAIAKLNSLDVSTPLDKTQQSRPGLLSAPLGRVLPGNSVGAMPVLTANIVKMVGKKGNTEVYEVEEEESDEQ